MKYINLKIFGISFLILFLELALIRFLSAQISYLGYYANFILLAAFVGIGLGMLLASNKRELIWYFPLSLLILIALTSFFQISIYPSTTGEIHFVSSFYGLIIPEIIFIPIIFLLTVLVFIFLSQKLGKLLNNQPPLKAYTADILGSLAGIGVFTLLSYLRTHPALWFTILTLTFILLFREKSYRWLNSFLTFLLIVYILVFALQNTIWSPYQKITVTPIYNQHTQQIDGYTLFVNNIGHQSVFNDISQKEWIYSIPYQIFKNNKFDKVLIIGAGMGTDTTLALNHANQIDAVEIDPEILNAGRKFNFYQPYDNPKVRVFIDDARSFLEKTKTKYDLIVFALPDSLMLASTHGNIRLESFLFTKEAFLSAKKHLNDNGAIVLYNYYRKPWIIAKLSGMLNEVFQRQSYVIQDNKALAAIVNGNRLNDLKTGIQPTVSFTTVPEPAKDSWPFLYLEKPSLPIYYLLMLSVILLLAYVGISFITRKNFYKSIEPTYFLLGTGFLLLETKSIIQFSLLFGATWITNALVFSAILFAILLAIRIATFLKSANLKFFYVALIISLTVQYFFPLELLLNLSLLLKYIIVSTITFTPVFLANIIFSLKFKGSKNNSVNFASNILGASFGGILEYSALLIGYHQLIIVIAAFYFIAFLIPKVIHRQIS